MPVGGECELQFKFIEYGETRSGNRSSGACELTCRTVEDDLSIFFLSHSN